MTTATLSTFFALLSLLCAIALGAVVTVAVAARIRGGASSAARLLAEIADAGLWAAALVAVVATAGSLYYSLGAHFEPCDLCWYQRICMYPLALLLPLAAHRRDHTVVRYTVPLAAIGLLIAAYHTQLQAFPEQATFCSLSAPCNVRFVWEMGFVSLPLMALVAFAFVLVMLVVAATSPTHRADASLMVRS